MTGAPPDSDPAAPEAVELTDGDVLDGAYVIKALIGRGGFGAVYRAEQLSVRRDVALKVIHHLWDPEAWASFEHEAHIIARLHHPNIVVIHDFGVHQRQGHTRSQPYLVMELLEGHNLRDALNRQGPLSAERATRLTLDALDALAHAHRKGIIHKDLKPSNLFIAHPGQRQEHLKLVDFGVATLHTAASPPPRGDSPLTQSSSRVVGTPRYLAPEALEERPLTPALDVYQMGLILAEMVSGRAVVEGESWWDCALRHVDGELPLPDALRDTGLTPVFRRATARDPADRYQDAAQMLHAVEEARGLTLQGHTTWRSPNPPQVAALGPLPTQANAWRAHPTSSPAAPTTATPAGVTLHQDMLATDALPWSPGAPLNFNHLLSSASLPASLGTRFVGRDELMGALKSHLVEGWTPNTPAPVVALTAGAGVGKTRLAVEFVWQHAAHFSGGVFWVDASSESRRLEALHGALSQLRPEVPPLDALLAQRTDIAGLLRQALATQALSAPVLWAVDNLPTPIAGQAPAPLASWCPALGCVPTLVTTRLRRADLNITHLQVPALPVDDGAALLITDMDAEELAPDDARKVVAWVDGLPLALELLNRSLVLGELSVDELMAACGDGDGGITPMLDARRDGLAEHLSPEALPGVADTLALSYTRLNPHAQALGRALAHMGPTPLPRELVSSLDAYVSREATDTTVTLRRACSQLVAHNIVTRVPGPFLGTLHRVMADFLRRQQPATETPRRAERAACDALRAALTPERRADPHHWPALSRCAPHAESYLGRLSPPHVTSDDIELALALSHFKERRGRFEEATAIAHCAVAWSRALHGDGDPTTLSALHTLGVALWGKGHPSGAERLLARVTAARQQALGPEHPDTLRSMEDWSTALKDRGDHSTALTLRAKVYERRRQTLGLDHPETLEVAIKLASALRATGDLQGADELGASTLRCAQETLGESHPLTLRALNNLASTKLAAGHADDAVRHHRAAVEARAELLGAEHPDTLWSRQRLVRSLRAANALDEAETLAVEVLTARRKRLGEEHPQTLRSRAALGELRAARGLHDEARRVWSAALDAMNRVIGPHHPDTARVRAQLAKLPMGATTE